MKSRYFFLIVISIFLAASSLMCSLTGRAGEPTPPGNPTPEVQWQSTVESLESTMQALAVTPSVKQQDAPSASAENTGSISGRLSYPSEAIPALRIVAFSVDSDAWYSMDVPMNTFEYTLTDLPAGTYHVVAYVLPSDTFPPLAGGYSEMVLCGLSVDCTDHSLADVIVTAGQDTPDINPGDWYAAEGFFPPMPEL